MIINSDTANKLIKQYQAEIDSLLQIESIGSTYSFGANEEPCKPDYSFTEMQVQLRGLQEKILKLRHAINVFNTGMELKDVGCTLDEALGRMSMLNKEKKRLYALLQTPEKRRERAYGGRDADFVCRNFDIADVRAAYDDVSKRLMDIQQAINTANLIEKFEVSI